MSKLKLWMAIVIMGILPLSFSYAGLVWQAGEGWVDEGGDAVHATTAKTQLDLARDLETKEIYKDALKAYESLLRRWPLSIYSGEAQFKIGLMNERTSDFWKAYKSYEKVVTKFPGSQFFDLAIERMYSIGNLYLSGEPQRLWKIPLPPSQEKTVQIFETVIKSAPYGKYAAASYFQIGQARETQQKWTQAIESYNTILDKYPGSDLAPDAQFQIGYVWLNAASAPDYDQSAAQKSIEAFEDYLVRFPNALKIDQAKNHIAGLKERISQGAFNIAKFYETQGNLKAAYIYYNEVVRQNPESQQAKTAKERIEALKPEVEIKGKVSPSNTNASISAFSNNQS
jgi:outer membrane protein assembly factor BamD